MTTSQAGSSTSYPPWLKAEETLSLLTIDAPGNGQPMGPTNTLEAEAYHAGVEKIMDHFRELLNEDRRDALVMMV